MSMLDPENDVKVMLNMSDNKGSRSVLFGYVDGTPVLVEMDEWAQRVFDAHAGSAALVELLANRRHVIELPSID